MNCRICKSNPQIKEENTVSVICGDCIQMKCLERYPYEEFKPKKYKPKKKRKKRSRKSRAELEQQKIQRWNDRLRKRRVK